MTTTGRAEAVGRRAKDTHDVTGLCMRRLEAIGRDDLKCELWVPISERLRAGGYAQLDAKVRRLTGWRDGGGGVSVPRHLVLFDLWRMQLCLRPEDA